MRTQVPESNAKHRASIKAREARGATLFDLLRRRATHPAREYLPLQFCRHYLAQLSKDDADGQLRLDLDDNPSSSDLTLSLRYLRSIRCDLSYLRKMYRFDLEEFARAKSSNAAAVMGVKQPRLILRA
jgi:hypothetical protein